MRLALALLLGFISGSIPLFAGQIVFQGLPSLRVISTVAKDDRQKLDSAAAQKAECIIVQRGKKYFWQSRGNGQMNRFDAPGFTYFVHTGGLGYVKVYTGLRKSDKDAVEYVESFTREFDVISYWGRVTLSGQ